MLWLGVGEGIAIEGCELRGRSCDGLLVQQLIFWPIKLLSTIPGDCALVGRRLPQRTAVTGLSGDSITTPPASKEQNALRLKPRILDLPRMQFSLHRL